MDHNQAAMSSTNTQSDLVVLLNILPEELWLKVCDKISNTDDVENLWNSSKFFRQLLNSRRPLFLFPKVWDIMGGMYHSMCFDDKRDGSESRLHSILKIRLICRCWADTIDKFYEGTRHHFKLVSNPMEKRDEILLGSWIFNQFGTHDVDQSRRFLKSFEDSHGGENCDRNPCFGRAVKIYTGLPIREYMYPENDESVVIPLQKYGKHIWHVTIEVCSNQSMIATLYSQLAEFLSLMPNLKYLNITFNPLSWVGMHVTHTLFRQCVIIDSLQMPRIEKLEFLRISQLPFGILNTIVRANNHVSALEIDNQDILFQFDCLNAMTIANLSHLTLKIYSVGQFQELENSGGNWPLSQITLTFVYNVNVEWSRIFGLLGQKWASTLTNVTLELPEWPKLGKMTDKIINECQSLRLNLHSWKSLRVKMTNLAMVDFLLPMRETLECLNLQLMYSNSQLCTYKQCEFRKNKQIIDFIGYHENCKLQSKVWQLFPNLRQVDINECVHFSSGLIRKKRWNDLCEFRFRRPNELSLKSQK